MDEDLVFGKVVEVARFTDDDLRDGPFASAADKGPAVCSDSLNSTTFVSC